MAGDENVLVTKLEARIRDFEKQMIKAEKTAQKNYAQMRKGSTTATKQMAGDMERSTRRINQALATTSTKVGAFGKAFGGLKGAAIGAVAGIFSVQKAFQGAQAAAADFDKIAKTARDTGLDSDFYQALGLAANESSISQEKLNAALVVFTKNAGLAASEQGTLYTQLKKMNPELLTAFRNASNQEERLRALADATAQASSATERAALASAAFGRTGVDLTRILAGGAKGFDDVAKRAQQLGIVIDRELLDSAEKLQTDFGVASQVLSVNMKGALVSLMPLMIDTARAAGVIAKQIAQIVDNVKDLENRSQSGIERQIADARILAQNNQGNSLGDMALAKIQELQGQLNQRAVNGINGQFQNGGGMSAFSRDSWLGGTNPQLEQEPATRKMITASIREQGSAMQLLNGYTGSSIDQYGRLEEQQMRISDVGRDAFGTLIGGLREGEKFSDALSRSLDGVLDKLVEMASNSLFGGSGPNLGGFLGSIMGGFGGGGAGSVALGASGITLGAQYHSGGIAGAPGSTMRAVSSSVFDGAPRYHAGGIAGLRPNEVPAILERGERIVPENQWRPSAGMVQPIAPRAQAQQVEVHVTMGVSADSAGNLTPYIEEVSSKQAVNVVAQAAPKIVDKSIQGAGNALGSGPFDASMKRFGGSPQAIRR